MVQLCHHQLHNHQHQELVFLNKDKSKTSVPPCSIVETDTAAFHLFCCTVKNRSQTNSTSQAAQVLLYRHDGFVPPFCMTSSCQTDEPLARSDCATTLYMQLSSLSECRMKRLNLLEMTFHDDVLT